MASCYGNISGPSSGVLSGLGYLPIKASLPDGTRVELDFFKKSEHEAGRRLLNHVIEEGLSWPFEEVLGMDGFRSYFLSHAAFVVRVIPSYPAAENPASHPASLCGSGGKSGDERSVIPPLSSQRLLVSPSLIGRPLETSSGATSPCAPSRALEEEDVRVWGAFYIKPNFPGRCSHVCNGGFITDPRRRRKGVARLMGQAFLRLARDLGYKASYFNLVFRSNEASLRLWRSLRFTELAVVPKAGRLKGIDGLVDAIQFYYDLETLEDKDLPEDLRAST